MVLPLRWPAIKLRTAFLQSNRFQTGQAWGSRFTTLYRYLLVPYSLFNLRFAPRAITPFKHWVRPLRSCVLRCTNATHTQHRYPLPPLPSLISRTVTVLR